MSHSLVQVDLAERSYDIHLAANIFSTETEQWAIAFESLQPIRHALIVCDEHVAATVGAQLKERLQAKHIRCDVIVVPSGEGSKSIEQLSSLWEKFLACKTDRKSVLFAVGGGVVGDLAGFAAATFARGLRFVQIPTTLLSMVDSSVGGKTGINLTSAKNIVGAFWQPSVVLIDIESLTTLPRREYLSGLAEVVKYGMIMDEAFFHRLESIAPKLVERSNEDLKEIIAQSCRCKAAVVQEDERETTGKRAILNYGHTFAHAIEATEGYGKYLHGEAVSIGMAMAGKLAVHLRLIDAASIDRQNVLLRRLDLPTEHRNFKLDVLWSAMQSDKKVELGKLGFILPTRIGHVQRVEGISFEQLKAAFDDKS